MQADAALLEQVARLARSVTPVTARGWIAEADWNVPVVIDGCNVSPGDLGGAPQCRRDRNRPDLA